MFSLWKAIIRPPRNRYSVCHMGPYSFRLANFSAEMAEAEEEALGDSQALQAASSAASRRGRRFERRDIQLDNGRGQVLECSHFAPEKERPDGTPCVVYLHGSSSSRLDALTVIPHVLRCGFSLMCFDFAGSGLSEGNYVSLGHYEKDDVRAVLRYLRTLRSVSSIVVWGRSMGAVAGLMCAVEDEQVAALVCESPFMDFRQLVIDVCKASFAVCPNWLVDRSLESVCQDVGERMGFDPRCVAPIRLAPQGRCPAFFGAASADALIPNYHVEALHEAWGGESKYGVFEGVHCDVRPEAWIWKIMSFLIHVIDDAAEDLARQRCMGFVVDTYLAATWTEGQADSAGREAARAPAAGAVSSGSGSSEGETEVTMRSTSASGASSSDPYLEPRSVARPHPEPSKKLRQPVFQEPPQPKADAKQASEDSCGAPGRAGACEAGCGAPQQEGEALALHPELWNAIEEHMQALLEEEEASAVPGVCDAIDVYLSRCDAVLSMASLPTSKRQDDQESLGLASRMTQFATPQSHASRDTSRGTCSEVASGTAEESTVTTSCEDNEPL